MTGAADTVTADSEEEGGGRHTNVKGKMRQQTLERTHRLALRAETAVDKYEKHLRD